MSTKTGDRDRQGKDEGKDKRERERERKIRGDRMMTRKGRESSQKEDED